MTLRRDATQEQREDTLDPADWERYRTLAHRLLDRALDHVRTTRERPVWQPVPESAKRALAEPLPVAGQGVERVCDDACRLLLPFATGNAHPRFFGWVHGAGTAGGILAELLAAALNANCGGRDHGAIYVERQVVAWCRELFGFPESASGLLVSGTSMATLIGLAVARHQATPDVRAAGRRAGELVGYASVAAHASIGRAFELLGLGHASLRLVPVDADYRIDLRALRRMFALDEAEGRRPFCVIGTAGTVDTGAIDDLAALAEICAERALWLHVDGAFGAWIVLSETLRHRLAGIERADSLAFDFHKWLHVPYDAGCVLVQRGDLHRATFATSASYLGQGARGLAGGEPWFCDYGPELSRGFRALKVWFTLKEHGTRRLGQAIERNCRQAHYLAGRISGHGNLELAAPVSLNIVCFRFAPPGTSGAALDRLNAEIVADLQESGIAAPSTTTIGGRTAIRVCLTNHRTRQDDLDQLLDAVVALGARRINAPDDFCPAQALIAPEPPLLCGRMREAERSAVLAVCRRPELCALGAGVSFRIDCGLDLPFLAEASAIALRSGEVAEPARAVLVRHALELTLWRRLRVARRAEDGLVIDLLAARTAGLYLRRLAIAEQAICAEALPEWLLAAYDIAAADVTPDAQLLLEEGPRLVLNRLGGLRDRRQERAPADLGTVLERFEQVRELAAPTEHLLVTGGGSRLRLDTGTGLNAYGCSPRPRPEALAFASSTASSISMPAFRAAEDLRQSLIASASTSDPSSACRSEAERIRCQIPIALGIGPGDDVAVILTPSGTDAELAALHLARGDPGRRLVNIVIAPEETGSGVALAAAGRHFSAETPHGAIVEPGGPVPGMASDLIDVSAVPIRDEHGRFRPLADIDADVADLVERAIGGGARCLIHLLDGSKTGLRAPSFEVLRRLHGRHAGTVDVVVDACQMRLPPERLRRYLNAGFMVLVTGSKFYGGPPFSGALLVPQQAGARSTEGAPLPAGLGGYFGAPEWPEDLQSLASRLPERVNLGLLLRWRAALWPMQAWQSVPPAKRLEIMNEIGAAARAALDASLWLRRIDAPDADHEWPETLFSFLVLRPAPAPQPIDLPAARQVHRWLNADLSGRLPVSDPAARRTLAAPCHIGQPVEIGAGAVLRICIGAHLVVETAYDRALGESFGARLGTQMERVRLIVSKVELIARHFDELAAGENPAGPEASAA